MAKGTLVFEFETAFDLENQMRAYLRLPKLQEITLGELEGEEATTQPVTRVVPGGTTFGSASSRSFTYPDAGADAGAVEAPPIAVPPLSPVEPTKAIVEEAGKIAQDELERQANSQAVAADETPPVTLETLGEVEYPVLLAFCKSNPGVGVDVSKSQQEFFRQFVEMKVKIWLETK
jgi:hypothetical protein